MVYWRLELEDKINMVMEEDRVMGIVIGKTTVFRVYGRSGGKRQQYEGLLDRIRGKIANRDTILVGD